MLNWLYNTALTGLHYSAQSVALYGLLLAVLWMVM